MASLSTTSDAGALREQVGAAGEGAVDLHAGAGDRRRDLGRRDVFRHVAGLEPRHRRSSVTPAASSAAISAAPTSVPFLQHQRALADRMHGDARRCASSGATAPNFMTRLHRRGSAATLRAAAR